MPTRNISLTPEQEEALRVQIQVGIDALERGDFTEIDEHDLERHVLALASSKAPAAGSRGSHRAVLDID
jgi:hypothetical protein